MKRILIAEDDTNLARLFYRTLRRYGYDVHAVGNGRQALYWIQGLAPDVMILDLGLPEISGTEIMRYIRTANHTQNTRIITITGRHITEDQEEAQLSDMLMMKPVSPRELVVMVGRVLGRTGFLVTDEQPESGEDRLVGR